MGSWVVPGYTEVRELGHGPAGRVVLAWHDLTGTPVAVRYLHDDLRRRLLAEHELLDTFRAESLRLSEIDSPHLVRHHEYVESADGIAVVTELVDGVSLRAILDQGGPLDPVAAAVVLRDSLLGLAAAHARGVPHRDQRSERVLVDSEGRAKLVAFAPPTRTGGAAPGTVATDLWAAVDTYRACLANGGGPPLRFGSPAGAGALLAELTGAAAGAYGPDWDARGRELLAERAARLLAVSAPADGPTFSPAPSASRWDNRVLVGVAVALAVAAALASVVAR